MTDSKAASAQQPSAADDSAGLSSAVSKLRFMSRGAELTAKQKLEQEQRAVIMTYGFDEFVRGCRLDTEEVGVERARVQGYQVGRGANTTTWGTSQAGPAAWTQVRGGLAGCPLPSAIVVSRSYGGFNPYVESMMAEVTKRSSKLKRKRIG